MSPVRGRRKRKEISDSDISEIDKKRSKNAHKQDTPDTGVEVSAFKDAEVSQNGTQNSHFNGNGRSENGSKTFELENQENFISTDETGKPLQSFHAKFTKCENSVQGEQCKVSKPACFACKAKDENVVKCSVSSCDKYYHSKCLEKLPTSKIESNACPLHLCLSCYNVNPKNSQLSKGLMYKCFKCPTAFHAKDECNIPGSVILTHEVMSCPDHFSPEKQREYPAVMNLVFCVQCGCNTDLIKCEFCPLSIHKHCIKDGTFLAGKYVCTRCETRRIIFYNDIVWAKICDFR